MDKALVIALGFLLENGHQCQIGSQTQRNPAGLIDPLSIVYHFNVWKYVRNQIPVHLFLPV